MDFSLPLRLAEHQHPPRSRTAHSDTVIRRNLELLSDDDTLERAEVVRLCTGDLDPMSRIVEDLPLLAKCRSPGFVVLEAAALPDLTGEHMPSCVC